MRDVQMPSREDASCEEEGDMNFAFTTAGGAGQFITASQMPKMQQQVANNGATLQQVVGMVGNDGNVQYVRAIDGSSLHTTQQLITLPIALPGAKPGDPQQTVQIQVLSPNLIQQQQPKFQMQIPIQGFQQGGAVLTVAYSPEGSEGMQLLGNTLPEGFQVVTQMPQELQLAPQSSKEQLQQQLLQQAFNIQAQQIIVTEDSNKLNNNTSNNNNNNVQHIVIKEECDDTNDDESSQGTEGAEEQNISWQTGNNQDLVNYLNKLPPQQTQALPVSLQQFLILNSGDTKKEQQEREIEIEIDIPSQDGKHEDEDGEDQDQPAKKKKKYKKKSPKPAKPKPGQVIIKETEDGTALFCCPECQMAYSEKEQLEMHLAVHKIERRFICGICGAGLKRKEHLERHKLGHNNERPYVCAVCRKGFKRREHLNLHTVIHSGVKTELCLECGKGFYRKDHLRKHKRSHETRRARAEFMGREQTNSPDVNAVQSPAPATVPQGELAEITIHVPTSGNMQVPVQINIPQHVMSSLTAAQAAQLSAAANMTPAQVAQLAAASPATSQLDALLAQHT